MNNKDFKHFFVEIAQTYGFKKAFGGLFKESDECIVILDLQKSNYANYYQLIIKIYVQGMFGNKYSISKNLIKIDTGDIFRGEPLEFKDLFNLDISMDDYNRNQMLEELFKEFIVSFSDTALHRKGLKSLEIQGKIYLLPAVKQELVTL